MRRQIQRLECDEISKSLRKLSFKPLNYGHFVCRKSAMEKAAYLPHYRLCIVAAGAFHFGKDADGYILNPNDVLIMAPNAIYRASSLEENSIFYYLDFTFDNPEDSAVFQNLLKFKNYRYFSTLLNERQMNNLLHMDKTVEINYPGTYLMVECLLLRILIVMLKVMKESNQTYLSKDNDSAKEKLILECIQYIESHVSEAFTIKEMADELNYTENYIYKCFKDTFQISCKTFILDFRLSRALHDLKSTSFSISEIASAIGFSSVYHFSASFKKKYGYSPSSLRKEI